MKRLPSTKKNITTGTFVRLVDLKASDNHVINKDKLTNRIYAVGSTDDRYPDDSLLLNTRTEYKRTANYYSGPLTDLQSGDSLYITSAMVEELPVKDPTEDLLTKDTYVLLLAVPGNDSLNGKLVQVGTGGLKRSLALRPDTYIGNVVVDGKNISVAGIKLKTVDIHSTSTNRCTHGNCVKDKWNSLDVCEEHALHVVHKMSSVCEESTCTKATQASHIRCTDHGGQDVSKTFYKIDNKSFIYPTIAEIYGDTVSWPDDAIRKATYVDNWGDWIPDNGLVGELVWKSNNKATQRELYTLKIVDNKGQERYCAIDALGVSLTVDPAQQKIKDKEADERQNLAKKKEDALNKAAELRRLVEELFDEKSSKKDVNNNETDETKNNATTTSVTATLSNENKPLDKTSGTALETSLKAAIATASATVASQIVNINNTKVSDNSVEKVQEVRMSKKDEIINTLKTDGSDAGVRVARKQFVKATREPLVAFLAGNLGDNSEATRKKVADFLDSELGEALISSLLSVGLTALPANWAGNPFVTKLTRELRVHGMTEAGDVVADLLMGPLRQVISFYAATAGTSETASEAPALPVVEQPKVPANLMVEQPAVVGVGGNSSGNNR